MPKLNENYQNVKDSYLFAEIARRVKVYEETHPEKAADIIRLGIGDVTLPLGKVVIAALYEGVDAMATSETFKGYGPEQGYEATRNAIADYYKKRKVSLLPEEVFVSSGASDELGDILDLFGRDKTVMIMEPAYPAYVDANIIAGNRIIHIPSGKENGFLPLPDETTAADVIYICSPNNPTGNGLTPAELDALLAELPVTTIVLVDEAYASFVSTDTDYIKMLVDKYPNLIISRTLSKFYGLPGLRMGFGFMSKELASFGKYSNKYLGYNRISEDIAIAALKSDAHYRNIARLMNESRACFEAEIGTLPGFKVYESVANFVLIKYPIVLKERLQKAFVDEDYKVKFMNEPDINTHLRITLGRPEQNRIVIDTIKKIALQ